MSKWYDLHAYVEQCKSLPPLPFPPLPHTRKEFKVLIHPPLTNILDLFLQDLQIGM